MTAIALVRHGRTDWNAERRMQGRTENPLNEEGLGQAEVVAPLLTPVRARRVISSPMLRAQQTADVIAERLSLPRDAHREALIERDFGSAEGVDIAEAYASHPDHDWPGSETVAEVGERGAAEIRALLAEGVDSIVVAHGTLLRLALGVLTGAPFPRFDNADVVLVRSAGTGAYEVEWLVGPAAEQLAR
ncbi:histidine phosphatase family protein [Arenivirga flava]|uniref:Fructose 1,6-bisphosphatase n=1 Tax=Arenivirga flava TaxID=1930060 RepID=A0AA37UCM8_9MICO|nr:histidine phosphatase family protein [Arenivirga flava]GMA28218.1 fructose 1,6-bisphosphatase [Arenivirga flava]